MEIGWTELLVIGIVALIVIGPKDLPAMFRELGRFTSKLQRMGREFSRAMEQAAKDSGVNDIAADLRSVTSPKSMGLNAVKSAADRFEKWDPLKPAVKPATQAVAPAVPTTEAAASAAPADVATPTTGTSATTIGPATAALADKVAARKAITAEAAAKLRAVSESKAPDAAVAADPAPKKPGRVRKPATPKGDA